MFSPPLSLFSTISTNSLGMLLRNGFSCTASPSHVLCNDFGSSSRQSKDVPILPVIETFLHYPRSPLHQPLPIQRTRLILLHKTIPCLCHPSLRLCILKHSEWSAWAGPTPVRGIRIQRLRYLKHSLPMDSLGYAWKTGFDGPLLISTISFKSAPPSNASFLLQLSRSLA